MLRGVFKNRSSDDTPIRVWVPGCSTGEEVYSLAIGLFESSGGTTVLNPSRSRDRPLPAGVKKGRTGGFPERLAEVSPRAPESVLHRGGQLLQINKGMRGVCVFSRQDLKT